MTKTFRHGLLQFPERHGFEMIEPIPTATTMVTKWHKMNLYAIKCRYGKSESLPESLPMFHMPNEINSEEISIIQLFKSLNCLKYQCSEGDTDKKFKKDFKMLNSYIDDIARNIVFKLPEYQICKWT